MRTAPGFVSLAFAAVAAGCGGGTPSTRTPIGNTIAPPPAQRWTLDRALATVPPDAAMVGWADIGRLRAGGILAPYLDQLAGFTRSTFQLECDLDFAGSVLMIATDSWSAPMTLWVFDVATDKLRTCVQDSPGSDAELAGDEIRITRGRDRMIVRILDDKTLVATVARGDTDAGDAVDAAIARRPKPASFPVLDGLRRSGHALWVLGQPTPTMPAGRFRTVALTASVTERIAVEVTFRLTEPAQAKVFEAAIKHQGQTLVGMGFATALDAHADGEVLVVHAEADTAAIDKMIQMATMYLGARGGNALTLPGGPFAPTPPTP